MMNMGEKTATVVATSNIAWIKYWVKRDEKLILPLNTSVSWTFDESLSAKTSVLFSSRLRKDALYLNGELLSLEDEDTKRRFEVINRLRRAAGSDDRALVISENNFPSGGGLASNAAGIAAMAYGASVALGLDIPMRDLSIITRQSTGSACRSLFGGVVVWHRGQATDGHDSFAEQVVNESYWPELVDVVAIVSSKKKKVSSNAGMRRTRETSKWLDVREKFAEEGAKTVIEATKARNFQVLSESIMDDSNSMHSLMMFDTRPPLFYLSEKTIEIMGAVYELNKSEGKNVAGFTLDAGPNTHIMTLEEYKPKVLGMLHNIGNIEEIRIAKAGGGPRVLSDSESLIDQEALAPIIRKVA
jgi:diphosphomevalonate decarboxylase